MQLSLEIYNKMLFNGGITLNNKGLENNLPKNGYLVAQKKKGLTIPLSELTYNRVRKAIRKLKCSQKEYFGFWIDDGVVYIDINKKYQYKKSAIKFGNDQMQKAIWDVEKNECVYLNKK